MTRADPTPSVTPLLDDLRALGSAEKRASMIRTGIKTERKNKAGNGARGRVPSRCAEATRGRRGESGTGAEGERARLQTDVGRGGSPRQRRDVSLSQPAAGRAERWRAEGAVAATGDGRAG